MARVGLVLHIWHLGHLIVVTLRIGCKPLKVLQRRVQLVGECRTEQCKAAFHCCSVESRETCMHLIDDTFVFPALYFED